MSRVVTYSTPGGNKIDLTPEQVDRLAAAGATLRDSRGEPFCQVSHGLHHGAPSPDADKMIDELLAWMAAR
jgi:hypothetical protein